MAKYLFEVCYTLDGVRGLLGEGGTAREAAAKAAAESVGGTLELFYFAFGGHDVYALVDFPDHESAAAFALRVSAGGGATVSTVVLLTSAEVDAAAAKQVGYRPPGG